MGRWHSWRLCRHAGFHVYRRLRSAIALAAQRESHMVSDRIFKNSIAVQSGFSGGELFPLGTASRVGLSPVGVHPRCSRCSQILTHEKNPFTSGCNTQLLFFSACNLNVVATLPDFGSLAREIGGD